MNDRDILNSWHTFIINRISDRSVRAYFVTLQFRNMEASDNSIMQRMHEDTTAFYGRLITRAAHSKSKRKKCPPIMVWTFDQPVPKNTKANTSGWNINNGLHIHAITLMPHIGDFQGLLKLHIDENLDAYLKHMNCLNSIDVMPILETPEKVASYFLKSVRRNRFGHEHIYLFPSSSTESTKKDYLG